MKGCLAATAAAGGGGCLVVVGSAIDKVVIVQCRCLTCGNTGISIVHGTYSGEFGCGNVHDLCCNVMMCDYNDTKRFVVSTLGRHLPFCPLVLACVLVLSLGDCYGQHKTLLCVCAT